MRLRFLLPLILLAGCGGGSKSLVQQAGGPTPPAAPPAGVPPAPTALLSATPAAVQTGQAVTLAWQTANATATSSATTATSTRPARLLMSLWPRRCDEVLRYERAKET